MAKIILLLSATLLFTIINFLKTKKIMSNIQDLIAKADLLQQTLDAKQAAIQQAIVDLQTTVSDLQAQIANGTDQVELNTLSNKLSAIQADLESTQVPPTQTNETEPAPVEGE